MWRGEKDVLLFKKEAEKESWERSKVYISQWDRNTAIQTGI